MENFTFNSTTKVIFGKNTESGVGAEIRAYGGKKALIHYGSERIRKNGLLGRIEVSLKEAGIEYVLLGGVVPNPVLSLVYKGIELCKQEGVDFLLAVGGGSVIDSCKAIGYGLKLNGDVWDVYDGKAVPADCMLIGAVVTIAAAGSETSNSSVITDDRTTIKKGYRNDLCRPKFAVMNPELTLSLPPFETACGVVDIMMHTLERYFAPRAQNKMTDLFAEALIKNTIANGEVVYKEPGNYNARSEILWAGSLSHNDLTGLGYAGDWACHQLCHELSGKYNAVHGAALSSVWGTWARYVYKEDIYRFVEFANKVWGIEINYSNLEETALQGIIANEQFFVSLNMPISLKQLLGKELTKEEAEELTERCTHFGKRSIGTFKKLQKDDIYNIYKKA